MRDLLEELFAFLLGALFGATLVTLLLCLTVIPWALGLAQMFKMVFGG